MRVRRPGSSRGKCEGCAGVESWGDAVRAGSVCVRLLTWGSGWYDGGTPVVKQSPSCATACGCGRDVVGAARGALESQNALA